MGLETYGPDTRPNNLNVNWPGPTDPLNKGDDHLRLVKTVILNFWKDVWDNPDNKDKLKSSIIPPAVNSAVAGKGLGGFRYQVVDVGGKKTLRLFTD